MVHEFVCKSMTIGNKVKIYYFIQMKKKKLKKKREKKPFSPLLDIGKTNLIFRMNKNKEQSD